jgi:hypothetical protein
MPALPLDYISVQIVVGTDLAAPVTDFQVGDGSVPIQPPAANVPVGADILAKTSVECSG